jgi:hypothetical protein
MGYERICTGQSKCIDIDMDVNVDITKETYQDMNGQVRICKVIQ